MAKLDEGHRLTDIELEKLEKRIAAEYKKAADEMQGKVDAYFQSFAKRDAAEKQKLEAGKITEQQYKQWRLAQIGRGKRLEALRDKLAERMTKANEVTAAYINDKTPGVYSLNRNYAAYTIEQHSGDIGFTLWDEQTVKRMIKEQPDLMPYYPPEKAVDRKIDLKWGKQQITAQVTTGILTGESLPKIAKRLEENIPKMERSSAIRAARTAMTGAQNAGRMDSYHAAEEMGIELRKSWLATLDNRTRHTHRILDGQTQEVDSPFVVDGREIMYPGDPNADGDLVYNCRCTMIADLPELHSSTAQRRARDPETGEVELIEDMTYKEWEEWKKTQGGGYALNGDKYASMPTYLGGVERGEKMTFAEANKRAANPGYRKGTGTAENCQSCVVAHEARMRGYDVEAVSYTKNKTAELLSENPYLAWVDPETGDIPASVPWDHKTTYDKRSFAEFLKNNVKKDGRYTLEFKWQNATGGHIVSVDRNESGELRIYDPQTGKSYTKDWEIDGLLSKARYTSKYGYSDPPHLLRVDTLAFREDVVNDILKEERAGWKRKIKAAEDDDDWIPF